ncbi:MAG: amidophosphoribosyltransferase [Acidobacteria bacterium]|nr:MAG: amidophosphoribosyltransferase [Acidobacteriota bacterium]
MKQFFIKANKYLDRDTTAFYHTPYTGFQNPGNPDYLNHLKNTYNSFSVQKLRSAVQALRSVLQEDLPQILQKLNVDLITVCVVPRAKAEKTYYANQKLFKTTVQEVIQQIDGFIDGTDYILRHTDTRTTHLPREMPNYNNNGPDPYPGITEDTCTISEEVRGKNILLVDDIYTPGVNVDEDAINALLKAGARTVTFYAVGYTMKRDQGWW